VQIKGGSGFGSQSYTKQKLSNLWEFTWRTQQRN